jgi:hypothetical protein
MKFGENSENTPDTFHLERRKKRNQVVYVFLFQISDFGVKNLGAGWFLEPQNFMISPNSH